MTLHYKATVFLFLLGALFNMSNAAEQSDCLALVDTQDLTIEYATLNRLNTLHSSMCENKEIRSKKNNSVDIGIAVKNIPVNLGYSGGSDKETITNFCSNFETYYSEQSESLSINKEFSDKQFDTVLACLKLESEKHSTDILPRIEDDYVFITIKRGNQNTKFVGLTYDSDAFECTGQKDGKKVPVEDLNGTELADAADLSLACEKKTITDEGIEYFPGGTIFVDTQHGDLAIPVHRESRYLPSRVSEWTTSLDILSNQNQQLSNDLSAAINRNIVVCDDSLDRNCMALAVNGAGNKRAGLFPAGPWFDGRSATSRRHIATHICKSLGLKYSAAPAKKTNIPCGNLLTVVGWNNNIKQLHHYKLPLCRQDFHTIKQIECKL